MGKVFFRRKVANTTNEEVVVGSQNNIIDVNNEPIRIGKSITVKDSTNLNEMARVGYIGGEFEVYVWTDDPGHVPHVHVRDTNSRGENFETCVQLTKNSYFLHGFYRDKFNAKARKAFAEFMEAPCHNKRYDTNYEYAVDMWNDNNSSEIVQLHQDDDGNIIIPNYRTIL